MNRLGNLNKEKIISLYLKEKKSLEEIAKIYGVSRVAIYKKLKKYGIRQRTKSEARIEAQKQGKLPQQFFEIDETFFSRWSPEMAYVLGLLITDGCISKTGTVSLCINDKDLLEKIRLAMKSSHKIEQSKYQKNLYIFHFARENMVKDLTELGVVPKKSVIVKFPDVPKEFISDFIRGVFDGDGCVILKKGASLPLITKFFSGSKDFIETLDIKLQELGLPKRTIYKQKTKNSFCYNIVYGHKDSLTLLKTIYKNIENGLFLDRKYYRFLDGLKLEKGAK